MIFNFVQSEFIVYLGFSHTLFYDCIVAFGTAGSIASVHFVGLQSVCQIATFFPSYQVIMGTLSNWGSIICAIVWVWNTGNKFQNMIL